jgi:glycosyltransferase involved in cell wall biosynthesis
MKKPLRGLINSFFNLMGLIIFPLWLTMFLISILPIRISQAKKRKQNVKPRIVWGPTCSLNNLYWSAAVNKHGYYSRTLAYSFDRYSSPSIFDYYMPRFFPHPLRILMPYMVFLWVAWKFEIFHFYFNVEGYLCPTWFKYFEYPLLKLLGKKLVVASYGSDVQRSSVIRGKYKYSIEKFMPKEKAERSILRNILFTSRWADFIFTGGDCFVFVPAYDFCADLLAIDLNRLIPNYPTPNNPNAIKICHATGHRHLKGTEYIISVCEELKQEGYDIELVLVEGLKNNVALEIYKQADIVVDQLLIGAYGMFAIEAMALGKPVLAHLNEDVIQMNVGMKECPIVNTSPDNLKENLRMLIENPELRAELGHRSRVYVEKYHSYEYIGGIFDKIYRKIWFGEELPWKNFCKEQALLKSDNSSGAVGVE